MTAGPATQLQKHLAYMHPSIPRQTLNTSMAFAPHPLRKTITSACTWIHKTAGLGDADAQAPYMHTLREIEQAFCIHCMRLFQESVHAQFFKHVQDPRNLTPSINNLREHMRHYFPHPSHQPILYPRT